MIGAAMARRGRKNLLHLRFARRELPLLQQAHADQKPALRIVRTGNQRLLVENLGLGPPPSPVKLNGLRQAHCRSILRYAPMPAAKLPMPSSGDTEQTGVRLKGEHS